jgi:hypothetical protein
MNEPEFIVFRTYLNHFEADIARTALEADGIECFIRSDDCGGMRPHFWLAGVELLLYRDDVEHAEEILGKEQTEPDRSSAWETTEPWRIPNPD